MTDAPPPDDRPPVDYRALLERYVRHVVACQGLHFISKFLRDNSRPEIQFTDDEWAELVRIGKLAKDDAN